LAAARGIGTAVSHPAPASRTIATRVVVAETVIRPAAHE
jgi:hypothetical protein